MYSEVAVNESFPLTNHFHINNSVIFLPGTNTLLNLSCHAELFTLLSFNMKLLKIIFFNVVIFKQKPTSFFMTQTRSVRAADYFHFTVEF